MAAAFADASPDCGDPMYICKGGCESGYIIHKEEWDVESRYRVQYYDEDGGPQQDWDTAVLDGLLEGLFDIDEASGMQYGCDFTTATVSLSYTCHKCSRDIIVRAEVSAKPVRKNDHEYRDVTGYEDARIVQILPQHIDKVSAAADDDAMYTCEECGSRYLVHSDDLADPGSLGDALLQIDDTDAMQYGGVFTTATVSLSYTCHKCSCDIDVDVEVSADPVWEDDHDYKMPYITHYDDAYIVELHPQANCFGRMDHSLRDAFVFDNEEIHELDWEEIEKFDSGSEVQLTIIACSPMNKGYCHLAFDKDAKCIRRPIYNAKPDRCCWNSAMKIGDCYIFEKYETDPTAFPHKTEDFIVKENPKFSENERDLYDLLFPTAYNSVEEILGNNVKIMNMMNGKPYVDEKTECPSAGILYCKGNSFSMCNIWGKKRIRMNGLDMAVTAKDCVDNKLDTLLVLSMGRPFTANGKFNPARCYLLVAGFIQKP